MNYEEIMIECEMIAIYNKEIGRAVARKKRLQEETRRQYLEKVAASENSDTPLAVVTITFENGETWDVLDPEPWLEIYRKTRQRYKTFYKEAIPEALDLYYEKGKTATEAYVRGCVSRTKFFEQRRKFIWLMAILASQNGLIPLE